MIILKLLFLLGVTSVELPKEEIGWVAVERVDREDHPLGADETDPSIWVVFAKKIDAEKFLISFPVEPTYKYLERDGSEMELSASHGGTEYLVQVLAPVEDFCQLRKESVAGAIHFFESKDEEGVEMIYWKGGYWYMERLVSTPNHAYLLQTKSIDFESHAHQKFVSSLNIE